MQTSAALFDLPREIIDLVYDHLFDCPVHPHSTRSRPCLAWHVDHRFASLPPLRLVCHDFSNALDPALFQSLSFKGPHRHDTFAAIAQTPHLAKHVTGMRLALSPRDFGKPWAAEIHGFPARDRARYYLEDLAAWVGPHLRNFKELRTLHMSTSYDGLHLAGTSRGELLMPCFEALCVVVRDAGLCHLQELQVELPYEGGYAGFFQDTGHKLVGVSDVLTTASVKLRDWQDNFTVMPIKL